MNNAEWIKEFPGAITVCNKDLIITEMNEKACKTFEKYGGASMIGKNLLDCHSLSSKEKILYILNNNKTNCYTIEKNGIKKMIYQSPTYKDGNISGLIELSLEIPFEMQHFKRS